MELFLNPGTGSTLAEARSYSKGHVQYGAQFRRQANAPVTAFPIKHTL